MELLNPSLFCCKIAIEFAVSLSVHIQWVWLHPADYLTFLGLYDLLY